MHDYDNTDEQTQADRAALKAALGTDTPREPYVSTLPTPKGIMCVDTKTGARCNVPHQSIEASARCCVRHARSIFLRTGKNDGHYRAPCRIATKNGTTNFDPIAGSELEAFIVAVKRGQM